MLFFYLFQDMLLASSTFLLLKSVYRALEFPTAVAERMRVNHAHVHIRMTQQDP